MVTLRSDRTGRFARRRPRDPISLYNDVRGVALEWARQQPEPVDPKRISQRQWTATKRALPEFEHLPNANEVCRQLGGQNGPLPWHELLDRAFDTRGPDRIHTARESTPDDFTVNDERVFFSMNRVAQALGQDWLSNVDYMHGYRLLVESDRRRKHGGHLEAQILTYSQIRHYIDQDWERACAIAELRSASQVPSLARRGVSTVDALVLLFHETARFASEPRLRRYAKDIGFALENRPRDRRWNTLVEEARQRILSETGVDPGPYDPSAHAEWETPAEAPTHQLPKRRRYSLHRAEVLLFVIQFVEERGHGARTSQPEWRIFQRRTGAPSIQTLKKHGGLTALVHEASRKGARERAERELHEHLNPTSDQKQARRLADAHEKAAAAKAQTLLQTLREVGGASVGELATYLGWAKDTVQVWLRPLKTTGQIRSVRVDRGEGLGTIDRYVAADSPLPTHAAEDQAALEAALKPAARRAHAALVKLGHGDSRMVAGELGIGAVPTAKLLTALLKAGFATHEVSGHPSGRGRLITYRPSDQPMPPRVETMPSVRRAVLEAVTMLEPARIGTIAEHVGKGRDAVRWQLEELVRAGYVQKSGTGERVGGMEVLEYRLSGETRPI
jgi:predicted ArsR family transcriptional regulator